VLLGSYSSCRDQDKESFCYWLVFTSSIPIGRCMDRLYLDWFIIIQCSSQIVTVGVRIRIFPIKVQWRDRPPKEELVVEITSPLLPDGRVILRPCRWWGRIILLGEDRVLDHRRDDRVIMILKWVKEESQPNRILVNPRKSRRRRILLLLLLLLLARRRRRKSLLPTKRTRLVRLGRYQPRKRNLPQRRNLRRNQKAKNVFWFEWPFLPAQGSISFSCNFRIYSFLVPSFYHSFLHTFTRLL